MKSITETWWSELSSAQKTQIVDTSTELVGHIRRWESLSKKEINLIFEVKINRFVETLNKLIELTKHNKIKWILSAAIIFNAKVLSKNYVFYKINDSFYLAEQDINFKIDLNNEVEIKQSSFVLEKANELYRLIELHYFKNIFNRETLVFDEIEFKNI